MASPVDAGRATSTSGATAVSTLAISLPTGITAGDLLIIWVNVLNATLTTPSGWTKLYDVGPFVPTNHDNAWQIVYYRVADGSEGSTQNISTAAGTARWSACVWRITGADTGAGTFIEISADSNQTSTATPDPPNLTPAGGAKDYLAIWCGLAAGTPTMPPSGNPTNYSNPIGVASGGTGAAGTKPCAFGATRQLTAATSENPPSWTLSASGLASAQTIMVYPAAGGQYTDSATVLVDIQPDDVETFEALDSGTVPMLLGVSATELREVTDSATVLIDIQTSGTEFPAKEYTDSATPSVKLTPSGTELREVTDTGTVPVTLTPSGTEFRETTEAATVLVDIQASGTDVYGQIGATAPFMRQPIIVGGTVYQDRSRW